MKEYKVNEIFYSLQGEGSNTGKPAVFVRFSGCNRACSFCDTDFNKFTTYTAEDIVVCIRRLLADSEVKEDAPVYIVLTGGEPTLQVDTRLIYVLLTSFKSRPTIQIETNGTTLSELPDEILSRVFLTISPKTLNDARSITKYLSESGSNLSCEIKIVSRSLCENDDDFKQTLEIFETVPETVQKFVQPCDSGNVAENTEEITKCVELVKANPNWRLSLQTHKIIGIQ